MSATLKDVAEIAGVDVSTASRVLNGSGFRVREDTRQRVLAAARELGYQPNALARSLRVGRTNLFALLVPDITNPFFAELSRGAEDATSSYGYYLILCNTEDRADTEEKYIRALRERQIDGFLLATGHSADGAARRLIEANHPVVLVNRRMQGVRSGYVVADDTPGARQAVSHLIELGHRRIAHIEGFPEADTAMRRKEAYLAIMSAHGLEKEAQEMTVPGDFTLKAGQRAMEQLLQLPEPPTAVFAANDIMALAAITTAREHGLRVPEDLAIVGFNDIALAKLSCPTLTTVRTPIYEMGALAAQMLLKRVKGEDLSPAGIVMKTELVVRESSGQPLHSRV
ncbi:MAG: LacI family DNA-binding transcriptional regulator [Chloroflexota bacterium]